VIEKFCASTSGSKTLGGAACAPDTTAVLAMAANAASHRYLNTIPPKIASAPITGATGRRYHRC
jgi:hypothetical protein